MPPATTHKERWKESPDDHDYPAAEDYLSLIASPATAKALARRMRSAPLGHRKAKDLLRASRLPVLTRDNFHVAKDLKKVAQGRLLSPVPCVRGTVRT